MHVTVGRCLMFYDEPVMVVLHGPQHETFLAVARSETDDVLDWMATQVSPEALEDIEQDRLPLHDAWTTRRIGPAWTGSFYAGQGEAVELHRMDAEPHPRDLPTPGAYLHRERIEPDALPRSTPVTPDSAAPAPG